MQAASRIAVAGATGRVGRHVVEVLQARGKDVVAMSRASGVDLLTGRGLAEALSGVACIIDASSGPEDQKQATEFFTATARSLHEAGKKAGVHRMIVVSIIGIDRFKAGYYAAKLAHEKAVMSGPLPTQLLRAAQFHELIGPLVEWGRRGEVCSLKKMRIQPVAARAVAEALADLATGSALPRTSGGSIPEIAGPRAEDVVALATMLMARQGDPVRIESVSDPADPDRDLYESGALLPGPSASLVGPTFAEWLDSNA